jgi:hypothetical protein
LLWIKTLTLPREETWNACVPLYSFACCSIAIPLFAFLISLVLDVSYYIEDVQILFIDELGLSV